MTAGARRDVAMHGAVLLAVVLALTLAARHLDTHRVAQELARAKLGWIALATLAYGSVLPLWALQWRMIAPQSAGNRYGAMLATVATSATMHNTAVAFVGEGSAIVMLVRRIGLARNAAVSVLAVDQVLVGIAKLTLLMLCGLLVTLPAWMARGVTVLSAVLGLSVAGIIGAMVLRRHHGLSQRLPPAIASVLDHASLAIARLRNPSVGASALAIAYAKKAMEVVALLCIQRAFGLHLPVASAVLALAALNLATMIPLVPGNVGVFEAAVVLSYARFGLPAEEAVGVAIVQHATYLAAFILPGTAYLLASTRRAAAA